MSRGIDPEDVHARALRGSRPETVSGIAALLGGGGAREADPAAAAWALAIRAAFAPHLSPPLDPSSIEPALLPPHLADVEASASVAPRAAALAYAHLARHAALALDAAMVTAIAGSAERLAQGAPEQVRVPAALASGWARWMRDDVAGLDPELAELERAARAEGSAVLVIDACALRALSAESRGEVEAMVATARRASRMARAEGIPISECLAHLVLARARRVSRHPHLAIRILGALRRVAPPGLGGWLDWESVLAGDSEALDRAREPALGTPSERASAALVAALRAAMRGDPAALDAAAAMLGESVRGASCVAREAQELLAALDVRRAPPPGLVEWSAARSILAPTSVHGLCVRMGDAASDASEGVVVAAPGGTPRRVLGIGAPLLGGDELVRLRKTRMRQGRVETLVAVLASALPGGLSESECFAQAYELAYQPEIHRGVFDVLVTRARAYLEGKGEIVRGQGRIALRLHAPLVIPDPRCAAPVHDRLLRILAREGRASAGEAARRAGLSIRAVQDALKTLAEEGACVGERDGRQIVYAVEDTTFSEPTERLALGRDRG